jgi:dienelactone hydrolase
MRLKRFGLVLLLVASPALANDRFTGPWKVDALKATPAATWGEPKGLVREVLYENVPLNGKPTRVFGYYARPKDGDGPFPAMVLVHGGGGHAFAEWATLWAERGYVALAMDLSGRGPDGKRLPDGGPEQSDVEKFRDFAPGEADQMWTYHAVAAAIGAHSLLASRPEVDKSRIGLTGISWGGYLTCIIAGVDDRVKVAVPVYGCGFLDENSYWIEPNFHKMGAAKTKQWADLFDPSRYLPGVSCPILFVNGTNDFAYPLDSYQKSYRLVTQTPVDLCVTVKMPHGHSEGWNPKEIGLFVDSILKSGKPLARLENPRLESDRISTRVTNARPIRSAKLHTTTDTGPWQTRDWKTTEAKVDGETIAAELPKGRPIVAFFTVEDDRGATTSSPHLTDAK